MSAGNLFDEDDRDDDTAGDDDEDGGAAPRGFTATGEDGAPRWQRTLAAEERPVAKEARSRPLAKPRAMRVRGSRS
jgi:hypothetical protein